MGTQFLEIGGQKMAVLPVADYERLLEIAEDKFDLIAAMNAERRRNEGEEYVPLELLNRILAGENPLRVWRSYRGLTLQGLAEKSQISIPFLSAIETGSRRGSPALWRKLAEALDVSADDILPDA